MINHGLTAVIMVLLLVGVACSPMAVSNEIDVEEFLSEAKLCFVGGGDHGSGDINELPEYLRRYLDEIEPTDYVNHRRLRSGEVLIDFRRPSSDGVIALGLEVDTNKEKGCGRIAVYEISS